jgi:LacI family transcriptional regulator
MSNPGANNIPSIRSTRQTSAGTAGKVVSLADIAKKAGVARMTVSRVLRNQPGHVGETTRARIRKMATQLGWRPDARIHTVLAQVRASKTRVPVPIAWLNAAPRNNEVWISGKAVAPYFEGARARCEETGYRLVNEFWLRAPGMTGRRMSQILVARGIQGIIVTPCDTIFHMGGLAWEKFAAVSFDKSLVAPRLHQASQDYHYNTLLALKHLRREGFRRIGVFLSQWPDTRSRHACHSAVMYFHSQVPEAERVPVSMLRRSFDPGPEFGAWLREHRPDVVVGQHSDLVKWVEAEGFRVPDDIGVAHMAIDDDCADWTGVWSCKREIGAAAAELLIAQLHTNAFGVPRTSHDLLVRGRWHRGWTTKYPKSA